MDFLDKNCIYCVQAISQGKDRDNRLIYIRVHRLLMDPINTPTRTMENYIPTIDNLSYEVDSYYKDVGLWSTKYNLRHSFLEKYILKRVGYPDDLPEYFL